MLLRRVVVVDLRSVVNDGAFVLRVDVLHRGFRHDVLLSWGEILLHHRFSLHRLFLRVYLFRPDADCERKGTAYQ
jgi:hypothetical protein